MIKKRATVNTNNEIYLGDGVYASFDGYQIWIWTSDGINQSHRIALEPKAMTSLVSYIKRCYGGHNDTKNS
jgi:hypothetical protein